MDPRIGLFSGTTGIEVTLLLSTFVLCSLIGIERQIWQKSAGYRTHVLVGLGSCAFTLVSAYGFAGVLGSDVSLDPSRIAAQIVSGIGFLGAGVIFKGRDVVRGLTTAATVWEAAAVGVACGAGMTSLGIALTVIHLFTLFFVAPLIRKIPTADRKRTLRITYLDGCGVLRQVLAVASSMGFTSTVLRSRRFGEDKPQVLIEVRFLGKHPLNNLIPPLMELPGVESVAIRGTNTRDSEQEYGNA
ncbi:MgtC/SapB family protein [Arthrobacter agilis]|uniref:MgtC/SapB family protein n=1 Tax=Arthrobacter agilis TaxID=37921 RepID=UPI0027809378|nr:MgtC/SapB family protein [Arthrobacter agilis]MDQ0736423.1 putative Mg2+ transporter-C (MgtC) family protein [Arthrobacter agilis]